MKRLFTIAFALLITAPVLAQGDTLYYQTYTFEEQNDPETAYDSPGRRWFNLPSDDGTEYQKILMYYTLKCFEDGTAGNLGYPCGEWDYLTYNYLFDHTGEMDSNFVEHPNMLLNAADFETVDFSLEPQEDSYQRTQLHTIDVTSENVVSTELLTGTGAEEIDLLTSTTGTKRSFFYFRQEELSAAGLTAGDIQQMQLEAAGTFAVNNARIRMMNTDIEELTGFFEGDWTEVAFRDLSVIETGWFPITFDEPFEWDGTSHVILEMSYDIGNTMNVVLMGGGTEFTSCAGTEVHDYAMQFNGNSSLEMGPQTHDFSNGFTMQSWVRWDAFNNWSRVMDWGNGSGVDNILVANQGGSNTLYFSTRIGTAATNMSVENAIPLGEWIHIACTVNENDTGKIYINGELLAEAPMQRPEGITRYINRVGWSNWPQNDPQLIGAMDEFQVYTTALDQQTIQDWMYRQVDDTHPNYFQIAAHFDFDDLDQYGINNLGDENSLTYTAGVPEIERLEGHRSFKEFATGTARPNVRFDQGDFTFNLMEVIAGYQWLQYPSTLTTFEEVNYFAVPTDVAFIWDDGTNYLINDAEAIADGSYELDNNEDNGLFGYYQAPYEVIDRYEVGRFITPYGINLTLDDDGWTWVYDVTDFEPLLHDSVELQFGNWQELLDVKFAYITGTPTREVMRIERLWDGNFGTGDLAQSWPAHDIDVMPGEEGFNLKLTTSGHGNPGCAEFCNNVHSVWVDGAQLYNWQIMQECADNALYPQGGTWIYDRGGWCPGAPVTEHNVELTGSIDGDSFEVDVNAANLNAGNYWFRGYLFSYGAPNFENEVEITEILSPSTNKLQSRVNPVCNKAKVRIRNNGTATLTSCTFEYSIGGATETYEWTGELGFMETADVELEVTDPSMWAGNEDELQTFEVSVMNPNGVTDENDSNNTSSSHFYRPPVYTYGEGDDDDNRLVMMTTTNNAYWETSWTLYNMEGGIVYQRNDFDAQFAYKDTLHLNQGCYYFHLEDSDDDGISFWANNDGSGSMRFKQVQGPYLHTFDGDFGKDIHHYFFWDTDLVSVDENPQPDHSLVAYPNPSQDIFNLRMKGFEGMVNLEVFDVRGSLVHSESFRPGIDTYIKTLDLGEFEQGLYMVRMNDGKVTSSTSILLQE